MVFLFHPVRHVYNSYWPASWNPNTQTCMTTYFNVRCQAETCYRKINVYFTKYFHSRKLFDPNSYLCAVTPPWLLHDPDLRAVHIHRLNGVHVILGRSGLDPSPRGAHHNHTAHDIYRLGGSKRQYAPSQLYQGHRLVSLDIVPVCVLYVCRVRGSAKCAPALLRVVHLVERQARETNQEKEQDQGNEMITDRSL